MDQMFQWCIYCPILCCRDNDVTEIYPACKVSAFAMYAQFFLCLYINDGWQYLFFVEGVNRVTGCIDEIRNLLNKTTPQSPPSQGGDKGELELPFL